MIRSRFILVTQHSREKPPEFFVVWISQVAQELLEGEPIRQSAKDSRVDPKSRSRKRRIKGFTGAFKWKPKNKPCFFHGIPRANYFTRFGREDFSPMTSSPGHSPEVACALALSRRGAEAHGVVLPGSNAIGKDRIGANPGKNEPVLT